MRAFATAPIAMLTAVTFVAMASVRNDIEASEQAHAYWRAHLSKCGQTYVGRSWYVDSAGGKIIQLTRVQFTFDGRRLTEADALNGVEWDGLAYVTGESRRTRRFASEPRQPRNRAAALPPDPWTAWEPSKTPVWLLHMRKTAGRWHVSPATDKNSLRDFEPWSCSDAAPDERQQSTP